MSNKIRINYHNMYKVLDYISDYPHAHHTGLVCIDETFYSGLRPMKKIKINQTLNALASEGVIEKYPPSMYSHFFSLRLTDKAFTYRLHTRLDKFRFWLPTVISIVAAVTAAAALFR